MSCNTIVAWIQYAPAMRGVKEQPEAPVAPLDPEAPLDPVEPALWITIRNPESVQHHHGVPLRPCDIMAALNSWET